MIAAVAATATVLAGCRVDARLDVTVRSDGTGALRATVALDADALRRLGGLDAAARQVRLDDLRGAGWEVSRWQPAPGGGAEIAFAHSFGDEADLAGRLAELVGPGGILREPRLERARGWFGTRDGFSVVVDLREPTTGLGRDADLANRLRFAGVDPVALDARLRAELRDALRVKVVVRLPGGVTRTYDAAPGTAGTVNVSRRATDWDRIVRVGIGGVLALLAVAFAAAASADARRERRRRARRARARGADAERVPLM